MLGYSLSSSEKTKRRDMSSEIQQLDNRCWREEIDLAVSHLYKEDSNTERFMRIDFDLRRFEYRSTDRRETDENSPVTKGGLI